MFNLPVPRIVLKITDSINQDVLYEQFWNYMKNIRNLSLNIFIAAVATLNKVARKISKFSFFPKILKMFVVSFIKPFQKDYPSYQSS